MVNILLGADPEVFVRKNGAFVSSHDLMPGSKQHPHKVSKGAVQVDGVAAEFNIDPVDNRDDFYTNITSVMQQLTKIIGEPYELVAAPTAHFDPDYFDSLPKTPKELGCTPDYNAYTRKVNRSPKTNQPFRTGAGHVHVGWDNFLDPHDSEHHLFCCALVKQLDAALFFSSLLWDSDEKRRTLYGKVGAFRPKSYGVEYRPMSNAWLNDPDLVYWVFDATQKATQMFFDGHRLYDTLEYKTILRAYMTEEQSPEDIMMYVSDTATRYGLPELPERYFQ